MSPVTAPFALTIDGKPAEALPGETVLQAARKAGIEIPVMCYFEGLSTVGACRLCLVEVEGSPKLFPACATPAAANQKVRTDSERLRKYRRMTMELFFAERNHVCSVCVANNNCELQDQARAVGMEHVRFPYLYQECRLDGSHEKFVMDHNRCILCTRCVRVCDEVEGAHNWDVLGRGYRSRVISDFNQPWKESVTCTSCGKCVQVCPTGALWPKDAATGRLEKNPASIVELVGRKGAAKR